jgi:hypothetical protein
LIATQLASDAILLKPIATEEVPAVVVPLPIATDWRPMASAFIDVESTPQVKIPGRLELLIATQLAAAVIPLPIIIEPEALAGVLDTPVVPPSEIKRALEALELNVPPAPSRA